MKSETELWAIVEVMGHSRYAGRVSEYAELGVPLVRVEVPETSSEPAFEKLLGVVLAIVAHDRLIMGRQWSEKR